MDFISGMIFGFLESRNFKFIRIVLDSSIFIGEVYGKFYGR